MASSITSQSQPFVPATAGNDVGGPSKEFLDSIVHSPNDPNRWVNASKAETDKAYAFITTEVFRSVGASKETHTKCWTDTCAKLKATKILEATAWGTWNGLVDCRRKLRAMDNYAEHNGKNGAMPQLCLPAPTLIAMYALSALRGCAGQTDSSTPLLIKHKQFQRIRTAIEAYPTTKSATFHITSVPVEEMACLVDEPTKHIQAFDPPAEGQSPISTMVQLMPSNSPARDLETNLDTILDGITPPRELMAADRTPQEDPQSIPALHDIVDRMEVDPPGDAVATQDEPTGQAPEKAQAPVGAAPFVPNKSPTMELRVTLFGQPSNPPFHLLGIYNEIRTTFFQRDLSISIMDKAFQIMRQRNGDDEQVVKIIKDVAWGPRRHRLSVLPGSMKQELWYWSKYKFPDLCDFLDTILNDDKTEVIVREPISSSTCFMATDNPLLDIAAMVALIGERVAKEPTVAFMHPAITHIAGLQRVAAQWTTRRLQQLRGTIADHRATIQQMDGVRITLQEDIERLREENQVLRANAQQVVATEATTQSDITRLANQHHQLVSEHNQLKAEHTQLASDRDHLVTTQNHLQAMNKCIGAELTQAVADRDRLKNEHDRLSAEYEHLKASNERLALAAEHSNSMLTEANTKLNSLKAAAREENESNTLNPPAEQLEHEYSYLKQSELCFKAVWMLRTSRSLTSLITRQPNLGRPA
ncbi:hypothetical protein B0I35DRAFT_479127 [Stachybotrys elegans]|uniref:Uncharacterized protein n=1 Tax=Stachybotrys elegans TaxID=80388 RepID=A0A8K0WSL5_9HYPO|nr:hypothetical protein B0I35DRAFT_479127 [Stachybotrys elegans]